MRGIPEIGRIRTFLGTDPAAGQEIVETVPVDQLWRLHSTSLSLVTSATVGNRTVRLELRDSAGNVLFSSETSAAQVASTTIRYQFANYGFAAVSPRLNVPFPIFLPPGATIRTVSTGLLAGDNYGPPLAILEDWDYEAILRAR